MKNVKEVICAQELRKSNGENPTEKLSNAMVKIPDFAKVLEKHHKLDTSSYRSS